MVVVGQPITDPISGPSFDFTFTIGPELDKSEFLFLVVCKKESFDERS